MCFFMFSLLEIVDFKNGCAKKKKKGVWCMEK